MAAGETDVHDRVMLEIVRHLARHFRKESPVVNVLVSLCADFAEGAGGADAVSAELTASLRLFCPLFFAQLRASLLADLPGAPSAKHERLVARHAALLRAVAGLCTLELGEGGDAWQEACYPFLFQLLLMLTRRARLPVCQANYLPNATYNDGTCQYGLIGCTVRADAPALRAHSRQQPRELRASQCRTC